jgi:hypothetical protein
MVSGIPVSERAGRIAFVHYSDLAGGFLTDTIAK